MRIPRRIGAVLAGCALVLGLAGAVPAVAASGAVLPGASTAHPYSDPIWFPLASDALMGCVKDNPGCPPTGIQDYWTWDIRGQNEAAHVYHQKVYAMGAGIVHVLANHQGCGGAREVHGNTLWIDHGAGVISLYEHLSSHFLVHDGDYVSARTPIAYMGQSGYTKCHQNPGVRFLALLVKHDATLTKSGGFTGNYVQIKTTFTCVHGSKESWPQNLPGNDGSWTRWYHVPVGTDIPNTSNSRPCINTPPATAPHPHNVALKKASKTSLKGSWKQPGAKYGVGSVLVQLQRFLSSTHSWTGVQSHDLQGDATSTTFTNLAHNGKYRIKVWFKNGVGWSKPSGWVQRVLS